MKINQQGYDKIIKGEVDETTLTSQDFVEDAKQRHYNFVLSNYIGHRNLAKEYFSFITINLMEHSSCQAIIGTARVDFGTKLAELLGGELIYKGAQLKDKLRGGVKHQGKRYQQLFFEINRKQALARPATIHLLRELST